VFGFLVRDKDLEVVEVALAVVTPWPLDCILSARVLLAIRMLALRTLLVQIRVSLALLRHLCGQLWVVKIGDDEVGEVAALSVSKLKLGA
jgi:hypothetical protein